MHSKPRDRDKGLINQNEKAIKYIKQFKKNSKCRPKSRQYNSTKTTALIKWRSEELPVCQQ
jgi:bifunctional ADP-heptose synthase (sugar kinase/adenylyltransferase)